MNVLRLPLFRTLMLALLGAWSAAALALDPINTGFFGNTAIKGYDAVAYHTDHKPVKGSKDYTVEWMGATWRFASAEHRDAFKADPERYAPQYGGYCAYAVSQNSTAGIDPEAFTVIGDKLYLNYDKTIQEKWEADRDAYIRDADRLWPGLLQK
ncbi:MAG: YHS domain-containing (seleno)protein [Nevskiales bacterium]|nr:YHS domain-containing (seleno)protein [Nevskiales bacterium]